MPHYADTAGYSKEEVRLWAQLMENQEKTFYTLKGLPFTYNVKGNELFFSRKEKSVTRASINRAYQKAISAEITGPKQLNVFGASYIYPIFLALGIIHCPA